MTSADVTYAYARLSVREFEARIAQLGNEVGAIIDEVDGVVRARDGGAHDIDWEDEDCELIPRRVVTHNHPTGDSFSPEDVRLAWEFGAAQVRAVTPYGRTYVLSAPERGWDAYSWDEIADVAKAWAESIFREIEEGRLNTSTPMDVIWRKVAVRLDLTYSQE